MVLDRRLGTETVQGTARALESVDDIEGSDGLAVEQQKRKDISSYLSGKFSQSKGIKGQTRGRKGADIGGWGKVAPTKTKLPVSMSDLPLSVFSVCDLYK